MKAEWIKNIILLNKKRNWLGKKGISSVVKILFLCVASWAFLGIFSSVISNYDAIETKVSQPWREHYFRCTHIVASSCNGAIKQQSNRVWGSMWASYDTNVKRKFSHIWVYKALILIRCSSASSITTNVVLWFIYMDSI